MDVQTLLDNVQELSDLELGVLLSLISQGHCLMTTEDGLIDDLANELSLIASERFGLSYVVLESEDLASVERFGSAILCDDSTQYPTDDDAKPGTLRSRLANLDIRAAPRRGEDDVRQHEQLDNRMIKNVVIAKGFNFAIEPVQIQAIEIITNRRVMSHTAIHAAPSTFLFVPIVAASSRNIRLIPHLNDRIFISHYHAPEHGFANLEELDQSVDSDISSGPSKQRSSWESAQQSRVITKDAIDKVRVMGEAAAITAEIRRYVQDLVTFLRIERGVDGGVTPQATTRFVALSKFLAPLHGIDFVTPALVALAMRKVYPHRIIVSEPARERSVQYGSDPEVIAELLEGLTPDDVIEAVLNTVPSPT